MAALRRAAGREAVRTWSTYSARPPAHVNCTKSERGREILISAAFENGILLSLPETPSLANENWRIEMSPRLACTSTLVVVSLLTVTVALRPSHRAPAKRPSGAAAVYWAAGANGRINGVYQQYAGCPDSNCPADGSAPSYVVQLQTTANAWLPDGTFVGTSTISGGGSMSSPGDASTIGWGHASDIGAAIAGAVALPVGVEIGSLLAPSIGATVWSLAGDLAFGVFAYSAAPIIGGALFVGGAVA
jgi:hypothetical protein